MNPERWNKIQSIFEKALELEPDDPQAHFNLAEYHYDNGDLKKAEKYSRQAITLDPDFSFAYLTLGNICLDQEQVQESIQCFKKFLKLEKSPASREICDEVAALIDGLKDEA